MKLTRGGIRLQPYEQALILCLWYEAGGPGRYLGAMSMTLESLAATRQLVAQYVHTTPTYAWPLLARATGADV